MVESPVTDACPTPALDGHGGQSSAEVEALASTVIDNGGVYFVPALTGLGAPHWDPHARGAIFGITRGTTAAHIARAALESICFQVDEVLQMLIIDSCQPISQLRVDGGAAVNNLMVQFQADISAIEVIRPNDLETTALGAAYLAGIAAKVWTIDELKKNWQVNRSFQSTLSEKDRSALNHQWHKAVARAKNWSADELP